jgi:hypothetical protein
MARSLITMALSFGDPNFIQVRHPFLAFYTLYREKNLSHLQRVNAHIKIIIVQYQFNIL